ncbi:ATPase family AAA domain-containing protein 5b isoform X2 [Oryzias melastigma]|uniref:ATPase family AAA domain-containing protein 5b isoform X2 n=1 Tax=Oryzias melastigma TaxID=30732 RepID=UPI000CF7F94C|nr:ATPase family AAA domain-containing protein 5b isoform X2 [Oryzias melastigma]
MTDGLNPSTNSRHVSCKDNRQPTIVIPSSESSCSDQEAPQEQKLSVNEVKTPRKRLKVFPIFLQNSKGNLSSERQLYQSAKRKAAFSTQKNDKRSTLLTHVTAEDGRGLFTRGEHLSKSELQSCLDEIQTSNPSFPVQTVFSALQKKACEDLLKSRGHASHTPLPSKEKRKGENDASERLTKRPRCCVPDQDLHRSFSAQKKPRGNKLSRTRRLKQNSSPAVQVKDCNQGHSGPELHQRDSYVEDTLWTDKYSPQHSSEVIGNASSVAKLHSWLKKWKLRANQDERRKMEESQRGEDDSWDCGDFQGESSSENPAEEFLWNTVLISGPPGVGKTASVYACSQELGFKVFEVNCSSQRSGRLLLSQLKEATQSHLVEISGEDPLKPAFFSSYNSSSSSSSTLRCTLGRTLFPKTLSSTSKKAAKRKPSSRHRKAAADALTLAHFFKPKDGADNPDRKILSVPFAGCDQAEAQSKSTATSLILFEEVDVIFKDDVGFLAAVKAFMKTTKRPVVLTTNDPLFKDRFDCSLEEITFKAPSEASVCSYLQLLSLAEKTRLRSGDARNLLALTGGDVRRCLLQLQLWVHSGGGGAQTSRLHSKFTKGSELPHHETSCSASMLGLQSVSPSHLLDYLKPKTDTKMFLKLLAESWRGGFPLLYSNLELLLSLGASLHSPEEETDSCLQPQHLHLQKRSSASVSCRKSVSRLSRRKSSSAGRGDTTNPRMTEESWIPNEADSLCALADFLDLMSYLDSTLPNAGTPVSRSSCSGAFVWTGAALGDGFLDEMSEEEEEERTCESKERLLDIRAAVEGLGFRICSRSASEAWISPHIEERESGRLEERVTTKKHTLSFTFQPLCAPSVFQRRLKLSRMVLSSRTFGLLGNRGAVCAEYMPVLRFICHKRKEQASSMLGLSNSTVRLLAKDFIWRSLERPPNQTPSSFTGIKSFPAPLM